MRIPKWEWKSEVRVAFCRTCTQLLHFYHPPFPLCLTSMLRHFYRKTAGSISWCRMCISLHGKTQTVSWLKVRPCRSRHLSSRESDYTLHMDDVQANRDFGWIKVEGIGPSIALWVGRIHPRNRFSVFYRNCQVPPEKRSRWPANYGALSVLWFTTQHHLSNSWRKCCNALI